MYDLDSSIQPCQRYSACLIIPKDVEVLASQQCRFWWYLLGCSCLFFSYDYASAEAEEALPSKKQRSSKKRAAAPLPAKRGNRASASGQSSEGRDNGSLDEDYLPPGQLHTSSYQIHDLKMV